MGDSFEGLVISCKSGKMLCKSTKAVNSKAKGEAQAYSHLLIERRHLVQIREELAL